MEALWVPVFEVSSLFQMIQLVRERVEFALAIPPPFKPAELPVKEQLVSTVEEPELMFIAPPLLVASFPEKEQLLRMDKELTMKTAPPPVPEEFPAIVELMWVGLDSKHTNAPP